MAGRPLRPATDRRLGEPLPHQLANPTWAHPSARGLTIPRFHPKISCGISPAFAGLFPTKGQIPMYYAPVRRSSARIATPVTARLACVKHAASVQSEPGSNSSVQWFELKRDPKLQTCPVLPGRLDAWLLAVAPMNGHLTRVPTQITCKFLDSTSVAEGRRRGRNYRREPHSVNLCIQTLTTRRENRGGIRCVRARIIGSEIALSTHRREIAQK